MTRRWIRNFIDSRSFKVGVDDAFSFRKQNRLGVPQETILGLLLFIIYTDDLLHLPINATAFADDITLCAASDSPASAIAILQEQANIASLWCEQNHMRISTKTTAQIFTRRRTETHTIQ